MNAETLTLDDKQIQAPTDLMSLKELCLKHGYSYDYLYKKSIREAEITVYYRGTWKLSEEEVLAYSQAERDKKLNNIKTGKGGNR